MAARLDVGPNVERLKMIQAIIARLAGNSFLLKGWTVTLVAGLTAFSRADSDRSFALIAVFVVVVFGVLDAYYLALEREYRRLYDAASAEADGSAEWTLAIRSPSVADVVSAVRSTPVWLLHGTALAVAVAVASA
jgi:hypothetical protein